MSAALQNQTIDDYANSMFRFERLHPAWITRCAHYLRHVFGTALEGGTVIDYAFGRGNWSLAFLEAGAAKVIAVDAAESNVLRFSGYVCAHGIQGIEVIQGNVLEKSIGRKADILWLYGILPCIADEAQFLSHMTQLWCDESTGLGLLYAYNAGSLREVVVGLARQALVYDSYAAFQEESLLFSHHARMRVRDDLTAPRALFHSQAAMESLLRQVAAEPVSFVPSFTQFENTENPEFAPHHLLFKRKGNAFHSSIASKQDTTLPQDEQLIGQLGQTVLKAATREQAKKFAIGLMNTHFSALALGGYEEALMQDFLFLLYACKTLDVASGGELMQLAEDALQNKLGRAVPKALADSQLAKALSAHSIRI